MKHILLIALFASVGAGLLPADVIFNVVVNTTPLEGESGYFAFDFIGGTPVEDNTVTISNFASDATLGTLTPTGGASGSISPGPGMLNDSQFFNELLEALTFGTTASFTLDLMTNATSVVIPDEFAFYLLDSTQNPFATSDPTGADSLFAINIEGSSLTPDVYTSSSAAATLASMSAVPEPSSFSLSALAFGVLVLVSSRRFLLSLVRRSKQETRLRQPAHRQHHFLAEFAAFQLAYTEEGPAPQPRQRSAQFRLEHHDQRDGRVGG
jgi:hypothetical protein